VTWKLERRLGVVAVGEEHNKVKRTKCEAGGKKKEVEKFFLKGFFCPGLEQF